MDDWTELDPGEIYELCPDCDGSCGGCITCWNTGLVEHQCEEALEDGWL